ncbi:AAA family ATPase [Dysgonomonas termitidis]|uniref:AAA family ATPase n=1 Tax=Dysgonomonas termitidis TaxID=1516126 RepID=A0ABV9KTV4_9BACT
MEVTAQIKQKVVDALLQDMKERGYDSQNKYARYIKNLLNIPFDKAALSQIKKEDKRNVIKDATWLTLAGYFNLLGDGHWQTARTHAYETMTAYLEMCKNHGVWRTVCDHASLGKTYSAEQFAKRNKGSVFYIKCSDCETKPEFIKALAMQFGIERRSSLRQMWVDATNELLLIKDPLLILDEFGDTHDQIITLMKSLYNKADRGDHLSLGVLHIGADNLMKRMDDGLRLRKPSYAEYFSRTGSEFLTLNYQSAKLSKIENQARMNLILNSDIEKITDLNLPETLLSHREEIIDQAFKKRNLRIIRDKIGILSSL